MEGEFYLPDRPQMPSLWPGLMEKLMSLRTLGVLGLGYRLVTEVFGLKAANSLMGTRYVLKCDLPLARPLGRELHWRDRQRF